MAKANMKQLMIDKGERYVFIGAGVLMLLLMIIGIMDLNASPDTEKFVGDVNQNSDRIKNSINSPNADVPPLSKEMRQVYAFPFVRMAELTAMNFDPIAPPDTRRTNPTVKQITEIEAKFMWAKIPALDIRDIGGKPHIGVMFVKAAKLENADKEKQNQFMKDLGGRLGVSLNRPKKNTNVGMIGQFGAMGGEGFKGGPVGPGPMGPGPMGIGPVGPGPMGPMGPGLGRFGGTGTGMEGRGPQVPFNPAEGNIETGPRLGIEYVPLEPEKLADKRVALTIYPQRMVIVHAAFPYREQVREFARALRFKDESEVFTTTDTAPIFKGFLIQRRILYPDQRVAVDWHNLNYESHYKDTIFPRALGDHEDPYELSYVKLPIESETVMPLPDLSALKGKYPEITLGSIQETIKRAVNLNKPPALPKAVSKLTGGGSIFNNNKLNQEGLLNQPKSPEMMFKEGRRPSGPEGGMTGTPSVVINELPEAILLRVIDNDIVPGKLYQYRMKMLMQNPNWAGPLDDKGELTQKNKFDLVTHRQDAKRMLLGASEEDARMIEQRFFADIKDEKARLEEVRWNVDKKDVATPWQEMKGYVRVPQEEYIFGVDAPLQTPDPKEPKKMVGVKLDPGQGMIQIQRWMPTASIKGDREPVADWVVADVMAKRGYYLGGEQFVNLPIWSSEFNRYVLRKVPAEKDAKQKDPRRGVMMDPIKPARYAVIDVEGGVISKRVGTRTIDDEAATEVLLVDENGGLRVYSSARDRTSVQRYMEDTFGPYVIHNQNQIAVWRENAKYGEHYRAINREEVWNKWVEETDKASRVFDPESAGGVNPMKKFD